MTRIFISKKVLDWYCDEEGGSSFPTEYSYRGHEIWRHARNRLAADCNDLDRIDCIGALKRAVNHRIKSIVQAYHFELLPSSHGKKRTLEKLREYGLVRPSIITALFEVRNSIEHVDADPPSLDQCVNYVDLVWYFLKSTDELVKMYKDGPVYTLFDESWTAESWFGLSPRLDKDWSFAARGSLPAELTRTRKSSSQYLEIKDAEIKRSKGKGGVVGFSGILYAEGDLLKLLAREHFSLSGFWHDDHIS